MKLFVCLTKKEKLHKCTLKNLLQGHYAKGFKPSGLPQVSYNYSIEHIKLCQYNFNNYL